MGGKTLKDVIRALKDRPLSTSERELFVNRQEELNRISTWAEYMEGDIIGIAGERGIGKTSLFNFLRLPGYEKVIINVVDRESKEGIISNIVEALYSYGRERGRPIAALRELLNALPLSLTLGPEVAKVKIERREEGVRGIVKKLGRAVEELFRGEKAVIILDEVDKEKKEDVLRIIDSIKDAFKFNTVTLIVALPYTIYEEMVGESLTGREEHNLDNVFDHIFPLDPLKDNDIVELLERRMPLSLIEEEALPLILDYARGNPRRAVRLVKEAALLSLSEGKVTKRAVEHVVRKYVRGFLEKHRIPERWVEILRKAEKGEGAEEIAKALGVSRVTVYRDLKEMERLGLWKDGPTRLGKLIAKMA